jgi:hypothetical protein
MRSEVGWAFWGWDSLINGVEVSGVVTQWQLSGSSCSQLSQLLLSCIPTVLPGSGGHLLFPGISEMILLETEMAYQQLALGVQADGRICGSEYL